MAELEMQTMRMQVNGQDIGSNFDVTQSAEGSGERQSVGRKWSEGLKGLRNKRNQNQNSNLSPIEQFVASDPWPVELQGTCVLFTFRSNVAYNGAEDPEVPVFGSGLTFLENDFIQVVQILSPMWWLGRVVGKSAVCELIPSPRKFAEKLEIQNKTKATKAALKEMEKKNKHKTKQNRNDDMDAGEMAATHAKSKVVTLLVPPAVNVFNKSAKLLKGDEICRQRKAGPVYDLAPPIRPLILVGPSKAEYEITSKMQRALINYLHISLEGRCQTVNVTPQNRKRNVDVETTVPFNVTSGLAATINAVASHNAPTNATGAMDKLKVEGAGDVPLPEASNGATTLFEKKDLENVVAIGKTRKLPILITDFDEIAALKTSALMPIVAFIKINNTHVLSKLIKSRNGTGLTAQLHHTEHLNSVDDLLYDIVLSKSKLSTSCYELSTFLDTYLNDVLIDPILDAHLQKLEPSDLV